MSELADFLEQYGDELAELARVTSKEIPDSPTVALSAMRKMSSIYGRSLSLLADIEGFLVKAKWEAIESVPDMKPLKAKAYAEAQVVDITRLRDKVDGNCRGLQEQIMTSKKIVSAHEHERMSLGGA